MGVALITPFKEDGSVDYAALLRLVDYQLQNNTITFNGQIEQKRTLTARTGSTSEKLKNLIEVTPNKNEMVSEAIAEATALITAHTHGYITTSDDSSELLISDTTDYRNATNIWRWNLNGLGHSSTGYSGTYTTALTMDGWIVGSRVAAGSIGASQLSIDYKNTVTEEITEKSDAAKLAANTYTDEQKAGSSSDGHRWCFQGRQFSYRPG